MPARTANAYSYGGCPISRSPLVLDERNAIWSKSQQTEKRKHNSFANRMICGGRATITSAQRF